MSELKDYDIMDIEAMDDARLEKSESGKIQVTRVYIKSEADKVIAELEKKLAVAQQALRLTEPKSKAKKCRYCQVHHREGYQRGADFGDGKDSFWMFNGGRIRAKRADWDFCLSSIKLNYCPHCGRKLTEAK